MNYSGGGESRGVDTGCISTIKPVLKPTQNSYVNGVGTWTLAEGQDFIADHASPAIDYATFHSWVSLL